MWGEGSSELLQAAHGELHWCSRGGRMEQEVALGRVPILCGTEQASRAAGLLPGTSAVCESV